MGLASFNRQRRMMRDASLSETKRFEEDNARRWSGHHAQDKRNKVDETALRRTEKAEEAGIKAIGEANERGIDDGDLEMRKEHAAEIAGRSPKSDPQGIVSPTDRLMERLPDDTSNEKLAEFTSVDGAGPPAELVEQAAVEVMGNSGVEEFDPDNPAEPLDPDDKPVVEDPESVGGLGNQISGDATEAAPAGPGTLTNVTETSTSETTETETETSTSESESGTSATETSESETTTEAAGSDDEAAKQAARDEAKGKVKIAEGWRELGAAERRKTADKILAVGGASTFTKNADEANNVIRDELARRGK